MATKTVAKCDLNGSAGDQKFSSSRQINGVVTVKT